MSSTDNTTLLSHFLQRLQNDVSRIDSLIQAVHDDVRFLVDSHQIESEDATFILSKVPGYVDPQAPSAASNRHGLSRSRGSLDSNDQTVLHDLSAADTLAPPSYSYPSTENVMNNVPRSTQPTAPKRQARALWDYNLDGEEPEDLSFEKGAIIEVIKENNEGILPFTMGSPFTAVTDERSPDWWTGKCNGRTGIFPSNYCELLQYPLPSWSMAVPPATVTKARPIPETAPKYVPYKAQHTENATNPVGARPHPHEDDLKKPKYTHSKNLSSGNGLSYGTAPATNASIVRAIF
ncbi:hypothetical protein FS842_011124 [Serendipita sp. 407]|nr:hypothetical protein FS842_011124 [Serendipita sp. 407]